MSTAHGDGSGSSASDHSDSNPLDVLLQRLRASLGELAPEAALERMQPAVEGFLAQFQLVPRRDFDAHMALLARLEETIAELETRIARLEEPPKAQEEASGSTDHSG